MVVAYLWEEMCRLHAFAESLQWGWKAFFHEAWKQKNPKTTLEDEMPTILFTPKW